MNTLEQNRIMFEALDHLASCGSQYAADALRKLGPKEPAQPSGGRLPGPQPDGMTTITRNIFAGLFDQIDRMEALKRDRRERAERRTEPDRRSTGR